MTSGEAVKKMRVGETGLGGNGTNVGEMGVDEGSFVGGRGSSRIDA